MRLPNFIAALAFFVLSLGALTAQQPSLRQQQERFPRVRAAAQEKDAVLRKLFGQKGLPYPPHIMVLCAFKKEGQLELWSGANDKDPLVLVRTYAICATSGKPGPKRRFGDEQVPEGFYDFDWFNPQSNFHLSLHISYPNAADRILKTSPNAGGDIFLHGNCVTIGCIPITDDGIKEVYWLGVLVRSSGSRRLPIYIFPTRLTDSGLRSLVATEHPSSATLAFWVNLQQGYDLFEKHHHALDVRVGKDGMYEFPD
jgi:murein L,D-transpeptidase YafK